MTILVADSPALRCHGGWILCGVILNALIVSAPLAVTGLQNRNGLPVLLLLIGSSVLCAMEFNHTLRHSEHLPRRDRYGLAALMGALLLLFIQWAAIVEFETAATVVHRGHPARIIAGCVFICIGIGVRSTAIQQLATGFRSSVQTTRLITTGIYARCRHPSETGLLLVMLGFTILLCAGWTAMVLLPPAYAVARWRIHLEESALRKTFGEQYTAYIARTSRGL